MPYALGAVQVQAGQTYTIPVGSAGTVGAVVCANESPYAVNASISATGAPGQWIVAQTADLIACDVIGFNGTLTFTTDNYLSNAASAPSFLLYLTAYAPGEAIRGTYPAPLMRLANGIATVANDPATTIERDLFTAFVYTGLIATADGSISNQIDVTSGIAYPQQADGSLLRQAPAATAWLTSAPNATYFLDLNPDGSWSFGTGHSTQSNHLTIAQATTNASGNIASVTDERNLNTTMLAQMAGNLIWNMITFVTALKGGGPVMDVNGAIQAAAPITLEAGIQESGMCGVQFVASAGAQTFGVGVNFKTVMTNVPSSISFAVITSANENSVIASHITQYGFFLGVSSAAAGAGFYVATYTTVGN